MKLSIHGLSMLALAVTFVAFPGCKKPADLPAGPASLDQKQARALIKDTMMTLLFPKLLKPVKSGDTPLAFSDDYLDLQKILALAPADYLFNYDKVSQWCGYASAASALHGIDQATHDQALANLQRTIDLLSGAATGDTSPLFNAGVKQLGPEAVSETVLRSHDGMRLFSTLFAIELLEDTEANLPSDVLASLDSYKKALVDLEALAEQIRKAKPRSDADLYAAPIVSAQNTLANDMIGSIVEFRRKYMSSDAKLGEFLALYGGQIDLSKLGTLSQKTHDLATINDRQLVYPEKITDPMQVVDLTDDVMAMMGRYFGAIDTTAAALSRLVGDEAQLTDPTARVQKFCAELPLRWQANAPAGQESKTAPQDILDDQNNKMSTTAGLAVDSPYVSSHLVPAR